MEAAALTEELPAIEWRNAPDYPPPSLNSFRTPASRAPPDCAPALWYKQMTGDVWDGKTHSYDLAKKKWRRLGDDDYHQRERIRLQKRDAARLPVLQEKREQQREEQRVQAVELRELMRADRIFGDLLDRTRLLPYYTDDPLYFEQPLDRSSKLDYYDAPAPEFQEVPVCPQRGWDRALREPGWRPSREWLWKMMRVDQNQIKRATDRLHADLIQSADFLELLDLPRDKPDGEREPDDEFVYHLRVGCELYLDFVARLDEAGEPFRLPSEEDSPSAAAVSRLGRQERASPGEEGAPLRWGGDDSLLVQTQVRAYFPVAAAEQLEQACVAWLYDHAPHVMAVLDRNGDDDLELYRMPGGSQPPDPSSLTGTVWRWRVEERPSREAVLQSGSLREDRRGVRCIDTGRQLNYCRWYRRADAEPMRPTVPKPRALKRCRCV
jgi:hypothetical protein